MTLQSADSRRGRGRATAVLANGALAIGLMAGVSAPTALADDNMNPTPLTPVALPPAAIVPNGVTGEAAKRAAAGDVPVDPAATGAATEAPMTADQVLTIIYNDYDVGAGGGQLSTLIHRVMQMRAQGFMPSMANKEAITDALDHRPNQGPLVDALKETLATQQKQKAQKDLMQGSGGGGPLTVGINQDDPDNPGVLGQFSITPQS